MEKIIDYNLVKPKQSYEIGEIVISKDTFGDFNVESTIVDTSIDNGIKLYTLNTGGAYTADEIKPIDGAYYDEGGVVKAYYIGEDDWGNALYKSDKGFIYAEVDGVLHHTTAEGEPLFPAHNVEKSEKDLKREDEKYAKGGSIGNELKKYFSKLNAAELPIKAADYLKTEILNDKDLALLDSDDEDFVEIKNIISSQYPNALKVKGSEPSKQEYLDALDSYNTMVEVSDGTEKNQYVEAIDAVKLMLELQFGEKYEYGGTVDCGCDHK